MASAHKSRTPAGSVAEPNKELNQLREENAQLVRAVDQSHDISIVVGILMERFNLDRLSAFESLRRQARARRIRMDVLAQALLGAEAQMQRFAGRQVAPAGESPTDH